uniref:PPUP8367 n=1 Tax=Poeciliopsis prolifica TaxID=188132 RepID=A0A0S7EU74_9TELE
MATNSHCSTETLFSVLQLGLMNNEAHICRGALKQRERGDKVMASRNIIKSELFHPAENRAVVAGGADAHSNLGVKEHGVFSTSPQKKNVFYKVNVGVEGKVCECCLSNMGLGTLHGPKTLQ